MVVCLCETDNLSWCTLPFHRGFLQTLELNVTLLDTSLNDVGYCTEQSLMFVLLRQEAAVS